MLDTRALARMRNSAAHISARNFAYLQFSIVAEQGCEHIPAFKSRFRP